MRRLHAAAVAAMDAPAMQKRLTTIGFAGGGPERRSCAYLGQCVARPIEKWSVAVKASIVQID